MHSNLRPRWALLGLAMVTMAFVTSACTDTQTVEVERPRFNPAPDSIAGFLGLYDVATNQSTCGNCHVNNQTEWAKTKHADAYVAQCQMKRVD